MNIRIFTGYLTKAAEEAYTPATPTSPPARKLIFDVIIKDSAGHTFPEPCVIENDALIAAMTPLLTAGKPVIIEGEQTATAWYDKGVLKGYRRRVLVRRCEVPNRSKAEATEEQEEAA
jgi:hypothetical protein